MVTLVTDSLMAHLHASNDMVEVCEIREYSFSSISNDSSVHKLKWNNTKLKPGEGTMSFPHPLVGKTKC